MSAATGCRLTRAAVAAALLLAVSPVLVLAKGGNHTWAPDIVRSGDRSLLYYSARD